MRSRFTRRSCERWDQSSAQFRYEREPLATSDELQRQAMAVSRSWDEDQQL